MNQFKKWISVLMICCMVFSVIPAISFAEEYTEGALITLEEEIWEMPELQTTGYEVSSFALDSSGNPTLKSTNEVKWIDRLADLPEYATDFYDWLLENSDGDGTDDALIDPTTGTAHNGSYVHPVVGFVDVPLSFTYPSGASDDEIGDAAVEVVSAILSENLSDASAYILATYSAFDRDHPEVFWLSGTSQYGSSASYSYSTNGDGTGSITYTQIINFYLQSTSGFDIRDTEYSSVATITSAISARDNAVNSIVADATGSRQAKIQHLNNWLTTNNCYNTSSDLSGISHDCNECISALKGSVGTSGPVCEAYARAFKVLCDSLDIPCVLVNGSSDSKKAHMWNYVQMDDGKWYAVDCTWNDPSVSGVTGAVSGYENEEYLLIGSSTEIDGKAFADSHLVTNIVTDGGVAFTNGPAIAELDYVTATTQTESLKQLYIEQHIEYANSEEYLDEIIAGYDTHLNAVLDDALSDNQVSGYNVLDAVNAWAELDFELDDSDLYELLLAQLLYSEQSRTQLQELYNSNVSAQVNEVLSCIFDNLENLPDAETLAKLKDLAQRLSLYEFGTPMYESIFSDIMDCLSEQSSPAQVTNALSGIAFVAEVGIEAISQTAATVKEVVEYVIYGQAYMNTSEDFKHVLTTLCVLSDYEISATHFYDKFGAWDAEVNYNSFVAAVYDFIIELEEFERAGAIAVANAAIEAAKENASSFGSKVITKAAVEGVNIMLSHIPILNALPVIQKGLELGQLIIDITTNIDERAYSVDMLKKCYFLAYLMDNVVNTYAALLAEDDFASAARFDESINVYKSIISIAADYGAKYEQELLIAENKKSLIFRSAKKASWYSTAISTMAVQKLMLEDIRCHSAGLVYDHNTGEITYESANLKVYTVACPVEVYVKTGTGEEIAFLSNSESVVTSGYEKYFFTCEIEDDSGDYLKVAIVPEDYEVTIRSSGTGNMNVYVANYTDGKIEEAAGFYDIPITESTEGYFIDSVQNQNLKDLVIDGTVYEGDTTEHEHNYAVPSFIWTEDHTACDATFTCIDGDDTQTVACTITSETTPATETEAGATVYTATVEFNGQTFTDTKTVEIPATGYLKGDINGDGKVNNRDAARLMQYLAGWDVECVEPALDVNGDGKVNNRDAARLMQYLAGWDVEIQ